jgi:hypothetical protein
MIALTMALGVAPLSDGDKVLCGGANRLMHETLRAYVRLAPNSGARADIPGPPLWATERTRSRGSALRAGRSLRQRRRFQLR